MKIDVIEDSSTTFLVLNGRLDTNSAAGAEKEISSCIESGARNIVFDFTNVEYISSAGLRVILKAAKQTRAVGGDMAIYGMREKIREVFEMSGFLNILTVRENREAAVSAVKG